MTIICQKCQIELRMKKAGATVKTMTTSGPYQLFSGDSYAYPSNGIEVMTHLGRPIAQHFQDDYAATVEAYKPDVQAWIDLREKLLYEHSTREGESLARFNAVRDQIEGRRAEKNRRAEKP